MKQFVENKLHALRQDEEGATLMELVIVLPTLLLLVLGAVEFGRFGYNEVLAHKATDLAVRTAAVRPAICAGVPETFEPGTGTAPRFGTLCRVGAAGSTCAIVTAADMPACTLATPDTNSPAAIAAADEIWQTILPLLPNTATRANVQISYTHDPNIGFLGGPYTPIVTAELVGIQFQTITPLGALAALATANPDNDVANSITFPNMSASLPAEDLGQGLGS